MNKLLTLCLSFLLIVTAAIPALAVDNTGTITVNHSKAGESYSFYKVMDLEYKAGPPEEFYYTINSDFTNYFAGKITGFANMTQDQKDRAAYNYINGRTTTLSEFASEIDQYAKTNSVAAKYKIASNESADGTSTKSGVEFGYYVMIPKDETTGGTLNTSSVFSVDTVTPTVTIENKSFYPTITKQVEDGSTFQSSSSAAIGDEVDFKITSAVPNMAGYNSYKFVVTDTISKGLHLSNGFGKNDVTVKVNNQPYNKYTVSVADGANDAKVITIDFTDFIDLKEQVGDSIEITYSATVGADAEIGAAGNSNSAKLTFSNDPTTAGTPGETTDDTPPSETKTYLSSFQLKKTKNDKTTPLAGATFTLSGNNSQRLSNAVITTTGSSTFNSSSNTWTIVTGNDGIIKVAGLKEGTYTLRETEPPHGFIALTQPITLTLNYDDTNNVFTDTATSAETGVIDSLTGGNTGEMTFNVVNQPAFKLPQTGAMGLATMTIIGLCFVALSMVFGRKTKRAQ